MREVALQEVLDARERRAQAQRELLSRHACPVLSYTMNIPGPVKNSPIIRRGFDEGLRLLEAALNEAGMTGKSRRLTYADTGNEFLCAVDADAETLKALCRRIEDESPLGRLFDMDVIGLDGQKLSRSGERRCLVCGAVGRGCASRRLHSLDELTKAVNTLLRNGLFSSEAATLGTLATKALLDEVDATPKPGLVDRNNNGSHADMTRDTFYASAQALRGFWPACFRIGAETSNEPPAQAFEKLRALGITAEKTMLEATGGVNTHKGAIFTLGTVCGAIGRLWQPSAPCRDPRRIARECAALCAEAAEADFAAAAASGLANSAGERIFLQYGLRGIRGEVADGLPAVLDCALPVLEQGLSDGLSHNNAGVYALLALIARGEDTNMIKRGGLETARQAAAEAASLLPRPTFAQIEALDGRFISQKLSPGGCADLLAVGYFLLDWSRGE